MSSSSSSDFGRKRYHQSQALKTRAAPRLGVHRHPLRMVTVSLRRKNSVHHYKHYEPPQTPHFSTPHHPKAPQPGIPTSSDRAPHPRITLTSPSHLTPTPPPLPPLIPPHPPQLPPHPPNYPLNPPLPQQIHQPLQHPLHLRLRLPPHPPHRHPSPQVLRRI